MKRSMLILALDPNCGLLIGGVIENDARALKCDVFDCLHGKGTGKCKEGCGDTQKRGCDVIHVNT